MPAISKNSMIFHKLTGVLAFGVLISLASCSGKNTPATSADGDSLASIAAQLHAKGNDGAAADFYSRALQQSPNDTHIRREFGEVLEANGDLNGALTQYRTALGIPSESTSTEITSNDTDLLRDYGRVLIKLGKPSEAQTAYARAVHVDSDDIRSLNGLGVSLDQLNNHEAAQKIYLEALDDKPGDFTTLANLGHSYVLSGAYDSAIKLLEPHLHDEGATPALRQNLAEAYGMAGMDADAERVSRYDLSAAQIKHNLAYYRSHRARAGSTSSLYADLGKFPTSEMASIHAEDVKTNFPSETEGLTVAAIPTVSEMGGTPSFTVHVTGFEKAGTLQTFCAKLKKQQIPCTTRIGSD